ncbi:MAG: carboxypeptidase-like regulatory domain-containing protein, partial [Bacteroidales bacterium]|nr:carboxypeptidase-like regulatory domain-containing protein [Bacteroidales bacterium]
MNLKKIFAVAAGLMLAISMAFAQKGNTVTAVLVDDSTEEPVGFATVSLQKPGADKVYKYVLSASDGKTTIEGVANGKYVFKTEIMGYTNFTKEIEGKGAA